MIALLATILPLVAGPIISGIGKLFKKKPKPGTEEAAKALVEGAVKGATDKIEKPAADVGKVGGILSKIGQFFVKDGALTKGGKIGLIGAGVGLVGSIIGGIFKRKKAKKLEAAKLAEQAKIAEANKIDPPQTFNRSMGYDPFAGSKDYFQSPFVTQSGPTNQFTGFNRGYQGAYPPPPRVNPFGTRPAFGRQPVNPRMAQFNPNANFRPFA